MLDLGKAMKSSRDTLFNEVDWFVHWCTTKVRKIDDSAAYIIPREIFSAY